jgi:hypothetical protein
MSRLKRLYYGLGRRLPFLKIAPPELDRKATLMLRPGRNSLLTWERRETGETILTVPANERAGRLTLWLAKRLKAPSERLVELDEVGGFVWELCDGQHTVDSIVQKTGKQYRMNRREAEVSVSMFLQMLHERNFIAFYKRVRGSAPNRHAPQPERQAD